MNKKYILNGLDCAHCAQKIADGINKLDGINSAQVIFATKTLKISAENEKAIDEAKKLVLQIEPDVKISEYSESDDDDERFSPVNIGVALLGIIIFSITLIFDLDKTPNTVLAVLAYILIGHKIIFNLFKKIKKFDFFDENFLMVVASAGAMIIGESLEGIAVMLFFQIGEFAQQKAVDNSRKSIKALMEIKPDTARVIEGETEKLCNPETVKIGDIIKILPGERIPLEGTVLSGSSAVDKSAVTGESLPESVKEGDEVISGTINKESVITVRVTKEYCDSTVAKILNLVENAGEKKAKKENFISKFAKVYTPIVVGLAVVLAVIGSIISGNTSDFIYRALFFLVVSCPCALVLSVPLCYFCGIGAGAKNGVLIKGGNYLEALCEIDTVVFDKTGTLTTGNFKVGECIAENGFDEKTVSEYSAAAESGSTHPIAKSISANFDFDKSELKSVTEISANGVIANYKGKTVLVGNERLLENNGIEFKRNDKNCVYTAIDNRFAGIITIEDEIKETSEYTVASLLKSGIKRIVMLTGDKFSSAKSTCEKLKISEFKAQCLPQDKSDYIENLCENNEVLFVGDGINDAPVITLADVGVAMGGVGSDSAVEAADIVLMKDDPKSLVFLFGLAKKTKKIVTQNIVFCIAVKVLIMVLSAIGVKGIMWAAVFADVGVACLAVLNSLRLINFSLQNGKSMIK